MAARVFYASSFANTMAQRKNTESQNLEHHLIIKTFRSVPVIHPHALDVKI